MLMTTFSKLEPEVMKCRSGIALCPTDLVGMNRSLIGGCKFFSWQPWEKNLHWATGDKIGKLSYFFLM